MARFVYWRAPDGRPHKHGDGKYAPVSLLREYGEGASVENGKGISWSKMMPFMHEMAMCSSAVVIDSAGNELNEEDSQIIVRSALHDAIRQAGGRKPIQPGSVILHADRIASKHFDLPIEKYVLVTTISIAKFPRRLVRIGGCDILPVNRRRSRFVHSDSFRSINHVRAFQKHIDHTNYQLVRIKTSGRCVHEAVHKALTAIHLLRGLWTLGSTYRRTSIRLGVRQQSPIGVVHIGPIHTLRRPDGELVENGFWYEPDYVEDQKSFTPSLGWEHLEKFRRDAARRISKHPCRNEIEGLVTRYVKALDNVNSDLALLQMWGILERLTGTIGAAYGKTIDRAIRFFKNRDSSKEQLGAVRVRRNQFVHASRSSENREQMVYLIKGFVEPHLLALIYNDFNVDSLEEYVDYLGLPAAPEKLVEQKETLARRQKQIRTILRMVKRKSS